jgi:hypothetical protein
VANIAQVSFSKKLFGDRCANIRHFPKIRHLPNLGFAQRALDAKNAEKRWRCGSSSLKDPVSIRGLSNARKRFVTETLVVSIS